MEINKISAYQYYREQSIASGHFNGRKITLGELANLSKFNQLAELGGIIDMSIQQQQHLMRLVQGSHSPLAARHIEVL